MHNFCITQKPIHKIIMPVKENIKLIREQKRYSQLYMANCLKISQSSYNKIENGQSQLSLERFHQICKIFDMTMDELYHFNTYSGNITIKKKTQNPTKNNLNQDDLISILNIVKEQENLIKNLIDNCK